MVSVPRTSPVMKIILCAKDSNVLSRCSYNSIPLIPGILISSRISAYLFSGQYADTLIGLKRLDNLQYCIDIVIKGNIKGDFIETGVWRGGACIFMKAVLDDLKHV